MGFSVKRRKLNVTLILIKPQRSHKSKLPDIVLPTFLFKSVILLNSSPMGFFHKSVFQYVRGGFKEKRENIRSDKRIGRPGEASAEEDGNREARCLLWHPHLALIARSY